jgi:outer membrane protein assembly factor BamB
LASQDQWLLDGWTTAGANPERTSWVPEEVRGNLVPAWYKQFEPYILPRTQIVATNGVLYIATARGLYALDAKTGDERWVYPTELPLGDTPTVDSSVVYVGGLDKKMHAVDAQTGVRLWFRRRRPGFQGSPLVVRDAVCGHRDGFACYSYRRSAGQMAWRHNR